MPVAPVDFHYKNVYLLLAMISKPNYSLYKRNKVVLTVVLLV